MQIEGLDNIDNRILEIIKDDARLTYMEIGKKAGISRVSVKNRMEALQEKGIIKGYQTLIDPTKIPEGTKCFLDIECVPSDYSDIVDYLAASRMIRQIYSVSGESRIHAIGFAPNARSLEYFANRIYQSQLGIRRLGCHTVLSTLLDVDGGIEYVRHQKHEHLEEGTGKQKPVQ